MKDQKYADIIHLSRPASARRRMSVLERAMQFSPFAALSGYEDAVAETGRRTEARREVSEDEAELLDGRLRALIGTGRPAYLTYFVPDRHKEGGTYVTVRAAITAADTVRRVLCLEGGETLPLDALVALELDK